MPRATRGSTYTEPTGTVGIRWPEGGRRPQRGGFRNKTEARAWFDENVAPRLRRGGPSAEITFDEFCDEYLARWEPTVAKRTRETLREWLAPVREHFGRFTLAELEGATDDIARWHSRQPSEHARYKRTRALRQVLAAAKRWGYIRTNPALDFGQNHEPRREEVWPFTRDEIDSIAVELGPYGGLLIFAAETGLRTNEWIALERRDIDRRNPAVIVTRRVTDGVMTPYPKTERRRVPLTPRALDALDSLPARLDTPLVFPAAQGGYIDLDNWRLRDWYPALEAAGIAKRGPYQARHTFATEALAAGVSIFQLARLMGASVKTIDRHYGHLAHDSEDHLRGLLAARSGVSVASAHQR
jgi:integrase